MFSSGSGGITDLTGDVTASGSGSVAASVAKIQGTAVTGTTGSGNVVLDNAPTLAGALNMNSHKITSVTDPTNPQDAATKNYADTLASALAPIQAVSAASATTNYPGTLLSGVLTITATGAISVDGQSPATNSRILLKDQSTGAQNGVYVVTNPGSGGISPVLTRAADYNTAADANAGTLVPVINGTANATTSWLQTATIVTIDVTALVFVEWTANPANYLLKANNLSDVTTKATAFNNISPMTSTFDMIAGSASGAGVRVAVGTSGQVLTYNGASILWSNPTGGGGAGSANSPFIDLVSAKTGVQRNGGYADSIYDAYFTGYNSALPWQQGLLLESITAGATLIRMAANAISPADTYLDATTGWSIGNQAASMAISTATKKVGPTGALQFSKLTGGTITVMSRTPSAFSLQNNLKHAFWMNFPASVTGLSQVFFRLGASLNQYMEWQFNSSSASTEAGSSIQVGWNLFLQDCAVGGTVVGTGWTNANVPAYYAIGFYALNTSAFSGILVDALYFGDSSTSGIQIGNELSIYNAATKDNVMVDSSSTKTTGTMFLASGVSDSYTADQTVFIQRSTVGASGAFAATIPGSSVYAGTVAEQRQTLKLQTDASGSNVEGFVDYYQNYFYQVVSTTAGSSANILVNAGSDIHTFYTNPSVIDVFQPLGDSNGQPFYKQRTGATYLVNGSATNSSGFITVPMSSVANIAANDYVIKRCVDLQISTTGSGVNESYTSLPVSRVEVVNPAIYIPDLNHVYGYYNLSGTTGVNNLILGSAGANGSLTGTLVTTNAYYNGKFSTGPFSTSNYYSIAGGQAISGAPADCTSMAVSFWFNAPQNSAERVLFAVTGGGANGHYIEITAANIVRVGSATSFVNSTSGNWTASVWNHVYYTIQGSTIIEMWINGVFIGSLTSITYTSPGVVNANIGIHGSIATALTNGDMADLVIWRNGAVLSAQQISSLYNNGIPPVLLGGNIFRNRYLNTSVTATGQFESKVVLTQSTSTESTSLRQWAIGRRS